MRFKRKRKITNAKIYEDKRDLYCIYLRMTYAKWVGYLFAWSVGVLTKPSGQAVIAITSATYMLVPVFSDGCGEPPNLLVKMVAVVIICICMLPNHNKYFISIVIQNVYNQVYHQQTL